jgi:hypothetical protein
VGDLNWIYVSKEWNKWLAVMNKEMDLCVPQIAGKLTEILKGSEEELCFIPLTVSIDLYIVREK